MVTVPALPVSAHLHLLLRWDVAVHQRVAFHTGHLDMGGNVPEFQAQVLPSDGDLGSPFPGARHWNDLERRSSLLLKLLLLPVTLAPCPKGALTAPKGTLI